MWEFRDRGWVGIVEGLREEGDCSFIISFCKICFFLFLISIYFILLFYCFLGYIFKVVV